LSCSVAIQVLLCHVRPCDQTHTCLFITSIAHDQRTCSSV
jgi:hypothetical protein